MKTSRVSFGGGVRFGVEEAEEEKTVLKCIAAYPNPIGGGIKSCI